MAEINPLLSDANNFNVNSEVLGLTPTIAGAGIMLSFAANWGREQITASHQAQLSATSAMLELVRVYGERGRRTDPAVTEALDLAKQVVAAQTP